MDGMGVPPEEQGTAGDTAVAELPAVAQATVAALEAVWRDGARGAHCSGRVGKAAVGDCLWATIRRKM